jgi:hypothetical protein
MVDSRLGPRDQASVPATVHARRFDDEVIILDLGASAYFSLDAVGALVWSELEAGHSSEEAARQVVAHFDVEFDRALKDTLELANELVARGLLVAGAPQAPQAPQKT